MGRCPSRCEGLYASHELGPAERADEEEGWCMGIRFLLAEQRKTLIQCRIFQAEESLSTVFAQFLLGWGDPHAGHPPPA
jgi:hypothetical protein